MGAPDTSIRLDTGAFGAARRRRAGRALAYWALLVAAAALVAGAIAAVAMVLSPATQPATLAQGAANRAAAPAKAAAATKHPEKTTTAAAAPAPPPSATPVAVWNGFGGQGAATTLADRARGAGYPVVTVRDAPRRGYRTTYVLYVPGQEPAGRALAKRLGLRDAAVRALDMPPAAIRPARLLVILAGS